MGAGARHQRAAEHFPLKKKRWGRLVGLIVRGIAGLALLALAFRGTDIRMVAASFVAVHFGWLLATAALVVLASILKALRWRILLASVLPATTLGQVLGPLLLGQAVNMLAWARSGDVARIVALRQSAKASAAGITATIVGEKFVDTLAIGLLAVLLVGRTVYLPARGVAVTLILAVAGLAALALTARWGAGLHLALVVRLARSGRHIPERLTGWLKAGLAAIQPLADARRLSVIYLLTTLIWGIAIATNMLLFRAMALPLPPQAALLVLVLVFVGVTPGLMPTNVGPFYFMTAVALGAHGVDRPLALAYAALLHLIVTGVPVVGTLVFLWLQRDKRHEIQRVLVEPETPL